MSTVGIFFEFKLSSAGNGKTLHLFLAKGIIFCLVYLDFTVLKSDSSIFVEGDIVSLVKI